MWASQWAVHQTRSWSYTSNNASEGNEGSDLEQEMGAPQAAVEPQPAGAAVVQALLQTLQGTPTWPPLHLAHHVLRAATAHRVLLVVLQVQANYAETQLTGKSLQQNLPQKVLHCHLCHLVTADVSLGGYLTKVLSSSDQLAHSSLVRVTTRTNMAAAATAAVFVALPLDVSTACAHACNSLLSQHAKLDHDAA